MSEHEFLTVAEVAARLRVTGSTITKLIQAGNIRAVRVGNLWRIPALALEEYLAAGQNKVSA